MEPEDSYPRSPGLDQLEKSTGNGTDLHIFHPQLPPQKILQPTNISPCARKLLQAFHDACGIGCHANHIPWQPPQATYTHISIGTIRQSNF